MREQRDLKNKTKRTQNKIDLSGSEEERSTDKMNLELIPIPFIKWFIAFNAVEQLG